MLSEVCAKQPFQKCLGFGGGGGVSGHIFEHRAANRTMYTKHALQSLEHSLFRVVIVSPLHTDWGPIGADTPVLVNGT